MSPSWCHTRHDIALFSIQKCRRDTTRMLFSPPIVPVQFIEFFCRVDSVPRRLPLEDMLSMIGQELPSAEQTKSWRESTSTHVLS